jgi:predicted nuclease with TOPRIM domain
LTKEMMEDLLRSVTKLLEEINELQTKSKQMDELFLSLEIRANNIELTLNGLQQNVVRLDQRIATVVERQLEKSTNKFLSQGIIQ